MTDGAQSGNSPLASTSLATFTKTGSQSFTPTYRASTKRINGGGYATTYDSNGNLTNDGLGKTFSWDTEANPYSVSNGSMPVAVSYDALHRAVENTVGRIVWDIYDAPMLRESDE